MCCKGGEQLLDAKVLDGGAEEHRGLFPGAIRFGIERLRGTLDQLDLVIKRRGHLAEKLACGGAMQPLNRTVLAHASFLTRLVRVDAILEKMVDPAQLPPHADGPGDGR